MAVARRQFTVTEYQRMAATGILQEDDRVELIDGEIFQMSPIGSRHVACVNRLVACISPQVAQAVIVSVQNPIQLTDYSQPQPDLALLGADADFYAAALPIPRDVLLLIEVADVSLEYDRDVKVPRYAEANIPEVWLVNVVGEDVTVYTEPQGSSYRTLQRFTAGQVIQPTQVPDLKVAVDDLF